MADLRLDVKDGALASRKNGSPIVPGKPEESLLIKRIFSEDASFRMPPPMAHKTLTAEQKETLRKWIEEGAPWKEHWSFIPPAKQNPPCVKDSDWVQDADRSIFVSTHRSRRSDPKFGSRSAYADSPRHA